jgi:hypothetical protein
MDRMLRFLESAGIMVTAAPGRSFLLAFGAGEPGQGANSEEQSNGESGDHVG